MLWHAIITATMHGHFLWRVMLLELVVSINGAMEGFRQSEVCYVEVTRQLMV